jgi:hypothetical protein
MLSSEPWHKVTALGFSALAMISDLRPLMPHLISLSSHASNGNLFFEALRGNRRLESLTISHTIFEEHELDRLIQVLPHVPNLQHLSVCVINTPLDRWSHMMEALARHPTLRSLDLFGDPEPAPPNPPTLIDLVDLVARMLSRNKLIETVDFYENQPFHSLLVPVKMALSH